MKKTLFLLLSAVLIAAAPSVVRAQTRADTAAVLLDAARRLQSEGENDAARALLDLVKRRYPDTAAGSTAVGLLATSVSRRHEESGRVELMVWSTAYGVWLGMATPAMLSSEEPAAYGAGLLAGAPLGFLGARQYLKSHPDLTVGQARAITFGGSWGTWQGFGWMQVLGDQTEKYECYDGTPCSVDTGPSTERVLAGMIGGGLAGIGTGMIVARKPINAGVAATVSASGLWGTWFGLALGAMLDQEEDNLFATTLLAGDATVLAAGIMAPRWNPSVNRVRLVSLSGLIGGVAGGGLVLIAQPENDKVIIGIPLATSIAGLLMGSHATRNYDRDHGSAGAQGNSLLHFDGEKVRAGVPGVTPVMRRDDRPGRHAQPALAVSLFTARF